MTSSFNHFVYYDFYFLGERNYFLVLEHANGGTLEKYSRDNTGTFEWKMQLKFARVQFFVYIDKEIIHGDLHSDNILIHQETIKLADLGCARIQGSNYHGNLCGAVPYMDPNIFSIQETEWDSYHLTKKYDIYSLGVLFWRLTSHKSPFNYEEIEKANRISLMLSILDGKREKPISKTDSRFVELYQSKNRARPEKNSKSWINSLF